MKAVQDSQLSMNENLHPGQVGKTVNMRYMGTLLIVGSEVMLQNSREAAKKGNKVGPSWLEWYFIVEVLPSCN